MDQHSQAVHGGCSGLAGHDQQLGIDGVVDQLDDNLIAVE